MVIEDENYPWIWPLLPFDTESIQLPDLLWEDREFDLNELGYANLNEPKSSFFEPETKLFIE